MVTDFTKQILGAVRLWQFSRKVGFTFYKLNLIGKGILYALIFTEFKQYHKTILASFYSNNFSKTVHAIIEF